MRIAVVGVGGIGSTFAYYLARNGRHDVTAVARPGSVRLQQLMRDGAIVTTAGERAEVGVADALDELAAYDLVLVTLLAHQVDAVLPALQRSSAASIQFMFNTFEPERLLEAIGAERCRFGMPFVQATLDADGLLHAKVTTPGQKSKMNDQRWVDVFAAAGLPAVYEPEMLLWLRCHAPLGASFESACYAAVQRGGGASWSEAMTIARGLHECLTMIERLGYRLYPAEKSRLHAFPVWALGAMFWSISRIASFRDLLATGIGECRALVDTMTSAAAHVEPPVDIAKIAAIAKP